MTYDTIVIGLGGMGSGAAYRLAARGQRVLGIERFPPAHDQGSSHGNSRICRLALAEDPSYVPLMRRSYELYDEVSRDSGRTLFTRTGLAIVGRPECGAVAGARRSAELWSLPHEVLSPAQAHDRVPTLRLADDEVAVLEPNAGFARPEETVLAHTELAQRAGAELHHGETVTGWSSTGDTVEVTTDRNTYSAGALVLAPGAWAPRLLTDLGVRLKVERKVMHWFEPTGGIAQFQADRHPVWIWEYDTDSVVYGFPAHDGEHAVKIASALRTEEVTPETLDRTVSPQEVAEVADKIRTRIPDLPGRHVRSVACMYTMTSDHHFAIGKHPSHANVTVACGFSGHGFTYVPVVGEVVADLAADGTTRHDIALFDPARTRSENAALAAAARPPEAAGQS